MKKRKVYACGVEWQHEFGDIACITYPSVESIKAQRGCWKECGIVELEVKEIKWISKQRLGKRRERPDEKEN